MKKRMAALALTIVLGAGSALTACGDGAKENTAGTESSTDSSANSTEENAAGAESGETEEETVEAKSLAEVTKENLESYLEADLLLSVKRINEELDVNDYVATWKITYQSDAETVVGYVAIPYGLLEQEAPYPCVIFNRGGNGTYGMLENDTAAGIAYSLDMIVVASQYRGVAGGTGQDEYGGADVEDVLALVDICREIELIDDEELFMLGLSRGGMMTYEALRETDSIKKAAVVSGVADLTATFESREDMQELCIELIGGTPEELPEEYEKRSAVCWAEEIETPLLLIHSKMDEQVPYEEAESLASSLQNLGKEVKLITREDGEHGIEESDLAAIKSWFESE